MAKAAKKVEAVEVEKVEEVVAEAKAVKVEIHPLAVIEGQLNIYENRVLSVYEGASVAVVENLGEGFLYVDNSGIQYSSEYELAPGERKEYKGAKNLFLSAASRPNFRIKFFK